MAQERLDLIRTQFMHARRFGCEGVVARVIQHLKFHPRGMNRMVWELGDINVLIDANRAGDRVSQKNTS